MLYCGRFLRRNSPTAVLDGMAHCARIENQRFQRWIHRNLISSEFHFQALLPLTVFFVQMRRLDMIACEHVFALSHQKLLDELQRLDTEFPCDDAKISICTRFPNSSYNRLIESIKHRASQSMLFISSPTQLVDIGSLLHVAFCINDDDAAFICLSFLCGYTRFWWRSHPCFKSSNVAPPPTSDTTTTVCTWLHCMPWLKLAPIFGAFVSSAPASIASSSDTISPSEAMVSLLGTLSAELLLVGRKIQDSVTLGVWQHFYASAPNATIQSEEPSSPLTQQLTQWTSVLEQQESSTDQLLSQLEAILSKLEAAVEWYANITREGAAFLSLHFQVTW